MIEQAKKMAAEIRFVDDEELPNTNVFREGADMIDALCAALDAADRELESTKLLLKMQPRPYADVDQLITERDALKAENEKLQSEVVNTKQYLGLSHVALALATQEANKYRYLREHHAKEILGSCFYFHATDDGQDDLDKVVGDAARAALGNK